MPVKSNLTAEYICSLFEQKAIKLITEVSTKIDSCLKKDWSPEQISGRMKKQKSYSVKRLTRHLKN